MSRRAIVKRAKIDRERRIVSFYCHPPLQGIYPGQWVTLSLWPGDVLQFIGANRDGLHQFMRQRLP